MDMLKKYATLLVSFRTVFVFWTDQTKDSHKSHQLSFFCQESTFEKQIASHVKNWSSTDGCRHFLSMQLIEEDKTNILQVKKHTIPKLDVYSWPISLKRRSRVSGPWDSMRPRRLESTVWDQEGMELGGDFQAFVDLKTQVMMVDQSFFSGIFVSWKLGRWSKKTRKLIEKLPAPLVLNMNFTFRSRALCEDLTFQMGWGEVFSWTTKTDVKMQKITWWKNTEIP